MDIENEIDYQNFKEKIIDLNKLTPFQIAILEFLSKSSEQSIKIKVNEILESNDTNISEILEKNKQSIINNGVYEIKIDESEKLDPQLPTLNGNKTQPLINKKTIYQQIEYLGLPRYILDDQPLGKGMVGVVHRAIDRKTGRICAIKASNLSGKIVATAIPKFFMEATSLARFDQIQTLAKVYDFSIKDGNPQIIMEYFSSKEYTNLYDREFLSNLSSEDIKNIIIQLAETIKSLYDLGKITNGDYKGDNIFIDIKTKKIKISDFSMSNWVDNSKPNLNEELKSFLLVVIDLLTCHDESLKSQLMSTKNMEITMTNYHKISERFRYYKDQDNKKFIDLNGLINFFTEILTAVKKPKIITKKVYQLNAKILEKSQIKIKNVEGLAQLFSNILNNDVYTDVIDVAKKIVNFI